MLKLETLEEMSFSEIDDIPHPNLRGTARCCSRHTAYPEEVNGLRRQHEDLRGRNQCAATSKI